MCMGLRVKFIQCERVIILRYTECFLDKRVHAPEATRSIVTGGCVSTDTRIGE